MKKNFMIALLAFAMMGTTQTFAQSNEAPKAEQKEVKHQARHVILWTLTPDLTQEQKNQILAKLQLTLKELEKKVPGAVKLDLIYQGKMASSNCDFMFDFIFDSKEALEAFGTNPDHMAAAKELKPYIVGRTCLDVAE